MDTYKAVDGWRVLCLCSRALTSMLREAPETIPILDYLNKYKEKDVSKWIFILDS